MKFFHLFFVAMLAVSLPAVGAKKRAMSLEDTVRVHQVGGAHASPNGQYIAYTKSIPRTLYKDDDGSHYVELHLLDANNKSRPFITGDVRVGNVQWSADSKHIYYTAKRNKDKFSAIYRIPVDGGESQKVVDHKNNISSFTINHDGSVLVFRAKEAKDKDAKKLKKKGFKAEVYEESAKFTHAYKVQLKKDDKKPEKMAIKANILSAVFHPSKNNLLMRVAPTPLIDDNYMSSQYQVFNLKGKKLVAIPSEGKLGAASWSTDGKHIGYIGAEDKHDPSSGRLFVANASSGKTKELLKDYMGHVRGIQWLSANELAYIGHVGTESEMGVVNIKSGDVTVGIEAGKGILHSFDADTKGQRIAAVVSRPNHPREVYVASRKDMKRVTETNTWLKDIKMPKQETVKFKSRDGLELEGVLVYPYGYKKSKRYPLVMMVHGGPEAHISNGWNERYSQPTKHMAANGYAILLPNYRGSTGRGVKFSKLGQADYAGGEFNDLVDAKEHLVKMGLVDKKRVGITGGSYGGYASAWAATALTEHFAASVMFVGISDQLSKFGTTDIPKEMYNVHARNYPWDKWQWMLERSPIYHADKARTPILIMHGKNDTRVHPSQSMEMYRYLKTHGKVPVRLVFYPGEGHGNRKAGAQLDYSMRLLRWMEFYLKGKKKKGMAMPGYEIDHAKRLSDKKS